MSNLDHKVMPHGMSMRQSPLLLMRYVEIYLDISHQSEIVFEMLHFLQEDNETEMIFHHFVARGTHFQMLYIGQWY